MAQSASGQRGQALIILVFVLIGLLAFLALLFLLRTYFRSTANTLFGRYWWKDDKLLPGD